MKNTIPALAVQPTRAAAPVPTIHISLKLHPTGHADGTRAAQVSQTLAITDKDSHATARQLAKGWKGERKVVEAWYRDKMVSPLKEALDWARDQMNQDLQLFDTAIDHEEQLDTSYVRERDRIEQAEAARLRQAAEAAEQARRDDAAAQAEAEALTLEAGSEALSERERIFIRLVLHSDRSPRAIINAAKVAGYKDAAMMSARLMDSAKMRAAMAQAEQAAAIRRQSDAAQAAPVIVDVAPVVSEIATVSGTSLRTYYGCATHVDVKLLLRAVLDGKVPAEAIQPNMVFLNAQARMLKTSFPSAYPGCTLASKDGIAG